MALIPWRFKVFVASIEQGFNTRRLASVIPLVREVMRNELWLSFVRIPVWLYRTLNALLVNRHSSLTGTPR